MDTAKRTACDGRVHGKHGPHGKRSACGERESGMGAPRRGEGARARPLPTNGDAALPAPLTAQARSYSRRLAHSRRAWFSRSGAAAFLSVVPQGALSPCTVHEEPPSPVASRDTPPQKHGRQTTGHPEPRRCASAKAREIPHPTEGRRLPVSTSKASAGCGACRTQSCLRGVGAKPAPTSP